MFGGRIHKSLRRRPRRCLRPATTVWFRASDQIANQQSDLRLQRQRARGRRRMPDRSCDSFLHRSDMPLLFVKTDLVIDIAKRERTADRLKLSDVIERMIV